MAARTSKILHNDEVKSRIQSSQLVQLLENHALNKGGHGRKILPSRIKAAEILLARTIPILSTVEQHQIDDRDKMTEADILAQAQALIAARPGLLVQLNEIAARIARQDGLAQPVAAPSESSTSEPKSHAA